MFSASALTALVFVARVLAQQAGTQTAETHPSLPIQQCTGSGSCSTLQTKIVLDSNWRWVHNTDGYTNCYTGNKWNADYCTKHTYP
jgi:cellulose 1,4-beta-cellobiosidase